MNRQDIADLIAKADGAGAGDLMRNALALLHCSNERGDEEVGQALVDDFWERTEGVDNATLMVALLNILSGLSQQCPDPGAFRTAIMLGMEMLAEDGPMSEAKGHA